MARIVINGRFATRHLTGVDRFASEILRAWYPEYALRRSVNLIIPAGSTIDSEFSCELPTTQVGFLGGHFWEQIEVPLHCRQDLLVSLCNTGPILKKRQLIVLHDANVLANPGDFSFAFRSWYRYLFAGLMKRSELVATVSEFSASELMLHLNMSARKIEVIYESGEHVLRAKADPAVLVRLGLLGQKYVLTVGSRTPSKNLEAVVKAADKLMDLDIKVVAAGGSNNRVFSRVNLAGDNLMLAGYVTDGELRALYENAQCFVFPSLYGGFGLPPLEAMHCGCPTLVSRRASLPEICGDAAVYFDPLDPEDIARQLRRVLSSASLRAALRESGTERVRLFSWKKAAAQLDQLITTIVEESE